MKRATVILLGCMLLLAAVDALATNTTINSSNRWVWSQGASWINARVDITNGVVIGQQYCQGKFYSATAGWISLGDGTPTNGMYYTNVSSNDFGVNHDGEGHLTGYGWCESTGWINFEWTNKTHSSAPRFDIRTGKFRGAVWGDALGWITLSNVSVHLETESLAAGADEDGDGIPDAWEREYAGDTNVLSASGDSDGDGITDYNEYVMGSHPTNPVPTPALEFASVVLTNNGENFVFQWTSEVTRVYFIEKRTNLLKGTWGDSGLGALTSSASKVTTVTLGITTESNCYYRIKVAMPPGT